MRSNEADIAFDFLAVAVAMRIADLRSQPTHPIDALTDARREELVESIGTADALVSRGDHRHRSGYDKRATSSRTALVEALALLAFCPGGIRFGGFHWEATHEPSKALQVGDRVRYTSAWLRSTFSYTGDAPFRRGTVLAISKAGICTVAWDGEEPKCCGCDGRGHYNAQPCDWCEGSGERYSHVLGINIERCELSQSEREKRWKELGLWSNIAT